MAELAPEYHTLRASDIIRDGIGLELYHSKSGKLLSEIFHSDITHEMTLSTFEPDIPLDIMERFIQRAKTDLL